MLLFLMSLASYRLTRLVTEDTFPPVLWARDRLAGGWREATQTEIDNQLPGLETMDDAPHRWVERVRWSPQWLADLISCTWCSSGWVSLGVIVVCAVFVGVPNPPLAWLAVWALSGLLAGQSWA